MLNFLSHLFDTHGFPAITKYGQSWEPWLIWLYLASKAMAVVAYVGLMVAFIKITMSWRAGHIDDSRAAVHIPRVVKFYLLAVMFDLALNVGQCVGFWYPAYRFLGVLSFLASGALLAASMKTGWAYLLCLTTKKETPDDDATRLGLP